MKLLVVTQKVDKNDDLLGFFHRWLIEFARHTETLTVICLYEGEHTLPKNVRVFSLGKEKGTSKFSQAIRFIRYIVRLRTEYDTVLVHMNPEYVVLGGLIWRLWGKTIALWYTHRSVNLKLRTAHLLSHRAYTASGYSFRLKSQKVRIVGHGIDTKVFACGERHLFIGDRVMILSVGSIRPIKNQLVLIDAAAILKKEWHRPFRVLIIGGVGDDSYARVLKDRIQEMQVEDVVELVGSIPNTDLPKYYCCADLTVNMAPDGGVDKVVLESMAAGVPALVANKAFLDVFGSSASMLMFPYNDARALSERIMSLSRSENISKLQNNLVTTVEERFSVDSLIARIVGDLSYTH